ncbi:hypothetical protein ACFL1G_09760 [Planctomycetota bacterium]
MANRKKEFLLVTMAGLLSCVLSGCGKDIETVEELAEELKKEGMQYTSIERKSAPGLKYGRIDEAFVLQGEELNVEIYRIEDRRTYKAFAGVALLLAVAERKTGEPLPDKPKLYSKKPFVIVVRREPETGCIKDVLDNIFGGTN